VPAIQPYIIELIWEQFSALLPERKTDHPLGCHRRRIPDRVVFEKLVQVPVFGCAYSGGSLMMSAPQAPCAADAMSG
jgi:transposase